MIKASNTRLGYSNYYIKTAPEFARCFYECNTLFI